MPCQAIRIVAKAMNIEYPNRRNSGSKIASSVVIACWRCPMIASRSSGMCRPLWLPPGPKVRRRVSEQISLRDGPVPQAFELHIHGARLRIAGAFVVDQQLLHKRGQELNAGLLLARADQAGPADLVEHCRRALGPRRIDGVLLQGVDRQQFLPTVVAKLSG